MTAMAVYIYRFEIKVFFNKTKMRSFVFILTVVFIGVDFTGCFPRMVYNTTNVVIFIFMKTNEKDYIDVFHVSCK